MGPPNVRVIWIFYPLIYEKHKDSKKGGAQICTSYVLFFVCVREQHTEKIHPGEAGRWKRSAKGQTPLCAWLIWCLKYTLHLRASAWELLISLFVCSKQNFYNFPGIKGFITRHGACLLFSQSVSQSVCNQFRPGPPNELKNQAAARSYIFIFLLLLWLV